MLTRRQLLLGGLGGAALLGARPAAAASRSDVLGVVKRVNDQWIGANADPGDNKWARATYFAGLTTLYRTTRQPRYLAYAQRWAESWDYGLNAGPASVAANDQCAGQAYVDLYAVAPDPHKIAAITASVRADVGAPDDAWWWVDALHMAMPSYVQVATAQGDDGVLATMWARYRSTRHLWNGADGLWFRDETFRPDGPYWSRGNGWAFAAHAKVLAARADLSPTYTATLRATAASLRARQRADGFWNVDLRDPHDDPGPESSGTALFLFGLATGIRLGLLSRATYLPVASAAWHALSSVAVQADGTLGYVQGVGKEPSSGQPVTRTSTADFGVGAFTSAGCAYAALLT